MSVDSLIPELWDPTILTSSEKTLVLARLANRDYEGQIQEKGDVVHINTIGDPTINTYSGTVSYEDLTSVDQTLLIDQQDYWAINVGDIDRKQALKGWVEKASTKGGVGFATKLDSFLFSLVDTAAEVGSAIGDEVTGVGINSANALDLFGQMGVLLDDKNVSPEGRFAIVSPAVYQKLVLAKVLEVTNNEAAFADASINNVAGFRVFKSQNVPQTNATTNHKCLFGISDGITVAQQILSIEGVRLEGEFGDGVRALSVYGGKVIDPNMLGVGFFDIAAEA